MCSKQRKKIDLSKNISNGGRIKKPSRGNGTASNDCLPYEKVFQVKVASEL
jgi:hypothetical protein